LKQHYVGSHVVCAMELGGEEINMLKMLLILALDIQQDFFKMTMKNQVVVAM
jgi:hypothetical protein